MDAVEFLKEANRMCCALECSECELNLHGCNIMGLGTNPCDAVKLVEQWSKGHPRKTRLQDFLEKYPNAILTQDNLKMPMVCARELGYCEHCTPCKYCKPDCYSCWNEPVED